MKEFHVKEPLYTIFDSMKVMSEFYKIGETVKVYKLKIL